MPRHTTSDNTRPHPKEITAAEAKGWLARPFPAREREERMARFMARVEIKLNRIPKRVAS